MRCRYPWPLKAVRFVENPLSFNQLNIPRADISCILGNGIRGAARSTQPVTLYITVNITIITPLNLDNSPSRIPTEVNDSPAQGATLPGRIQPPAPEHLLPLSHHQPVETEITMSQSAEEASLTGNKDSRPGIHQADEAMERFERSNTCERAIRRIKWVMDTLSPVAEVRVTPL